MIISINCPCCTEEIQIELQVFQPDNNFKSVEIARVTDDD